MATTPTPIFLQAAKRSGVQILPADASNLKTVYAGGTNGSKVTSVIATSTDTSSRDVTLGVTNGGTFYPLGTVTLPITAGTIAATIAVNVLDPNVIKGLPVDNDGQTYLFLTSADILQVKALTTVTAAKEIDFNAFGSDF